MFWEHNLLRPKTTIFRLVNGRQLRKTGKDYYPDQALAKMGTSVIREQLFDHVYRSISHSVYKVYDLVDTNLHTCPPYNAYTISRAQ